MVFNESGTHVKWLLGAVVAFGVACGTVINFETDDKISVTRGVFITLMVRESSVVGVRSVLLPIRSLLYYYNIFFIDDADS